MPNPERNGINNSRVDLPLPKLRKRKDFSLKKEFLLLREQHPFSSIKKEKKRAFIVLCLFIISITLISLLFNDFAPVKRIYQYLTHLFVIKNLVIAGNRELTEDDIMDIAGLRRSSFLKTNSKDLERLLKSHPMITKARVTKSYPNKISIRLEEKDIAAMIQTKEGFLWASSWDGYILPCASSHYILPRIELDINDEEAYPGAIINDPCFYQALSLIASDKKKELYKVIFKRGRHASEAENGLLCAISIKSPRDTLCFGQGDYEHKWFKLSQAELYGSEGQFIDLRFRNQVIIRGLRSAEKRIGNLKSIAVSSTKEEKQNFNDKKREAIIPKRG